MNIETYLQGFAETIAAEGGEAIRSRAGEIDVVRTATGGAIGWRSPEAVTLDDRELHLAASLVRNLTSHAAQIAQVERDPDLSDSAKARKIEVIGNEARTRAEGIEREAMDVLAAVERAQASLAPPRAADAIEATEDGEVRAHVRSLAAEAQTALAQTLMDGKDDRILLALMRSPLPLTGVLAEALPEAWRRHVGRSDPDRSRALARGKELSEWLGVILEQTHGALPRPAPMTISQQRDSDIAARRKAG